MSKSTERIVDVLNVQEDGFEIRSLSFMWVLGESRGWGEEIIRQNCHTLVEVQQTIPCYFLSISPTNPQDPSA